jgi:cytochrome c oxidase subunit 2
VVAVVAVVSVACSSPGLDVSLSPDGERGRTVAERVGCSNCHGGPERNGGVGPGFVGSWGSAVDLEDGSSVVFDESYVIESVRSPDAARRSGDWVRMPAFGPDQLTDAELDDLVDYLRELGADS